jgi:hypothetical protein
MSVYGEAWEPDAGDGQNAEVWSPLLGRWLGGFSIVGRDGDLLAIRPASMRLCSPSSSARPTCASPAVT